MEPGKCHGSRVFGEMILQKPCFLLRERGGIRAGKPGLTSTVTSTAIRSEATIIPKLHFLSPVFKASISS